MKTSVPNITFMNSDNLVNQFLSVNKESISDYTVNYAAKLPSMSKRYAIRQ